MPQLGFTPYTPGVTNRVPGFPGSLMSDIDKYDVNQPVACAANTDLRPANHWCVGCNTGLAETQCGESAG